MGLWERRERRKGGCGEIISREKRERALESDANRLRGLKRASR